MSTAFSQRDPRWSHDKLGTCDLSLADAGCLVSSMASVLVDFEIPSDPGRLNRWLAAHGGYVRGCLFVWNSVRGLGAILEELIRCPTTPAPMEHIADALAAGRSVVAEVDAKPGGAVQQHWVRILKVMDSECLVMDPWQLPGQEVIELLDYYGAPGWNSARAIFMVAIYARKTDRVMSFSYGDPDLADAQTAVAMRREHARRKRIDQA